MIQGIPQHVRSHGRSEGSGPSRVRAPAARWALLANAIAARPIDVVEAEGAVTWSDGRTIHLSPDTPDPEIAVSVHAALAGAGSFDRDALRRLRRRSGAAERYVLLEATRAVALLEPIIPSATAEAVRAIGAPRSPSASRSAEIALSRIALPEPDRHFGLVRTGRSEPATTGTGATPGPAPSTVTPSLTPDDDDDEDVQGDDPLLKLLRKLLGDGPGNGFAARFLSRFLRSQRRRTSGALAGTGGGELAIAGATLPGEGRHPVLALRPSPVSAQSAPPAPIVRRYPEWDVETRRYRPDWCRVLEVEPGSSGEPLPRPSRDDDLRRRIAAVSVGVGRYRRQPHGDELDLDAVVESEVSRRAGGKPDEDVYIDRLHRSRELSVLVLLDISGSAGERVADGGRVHDRQRDLAALLIDTFDVVGDRTAAYAFHSRGREHVHLVPIKRFDRALDGDALARFGRCEPGAFTRFGAAVRHGTRQLLDCGGTEHLLLLVLSDGFAYDEGYEGTAAEADASRALEEARASGVAAVCLNVGASTEDASLERVFGTASYAAGESFDDIREKMALLLRAALRDAGRAGRQMIRAERNAA